MKVAYTLAGLLGISFVIIIHEMGHFLCAKLFGVITPLFSLGFGPSLFSVTCGETIFQIALLPFGGYVEMDPQSFAAQPYIAKLCIVSAGIMFNFIFAYTIFMYYALSKKLLLPVPDTIAPATPEENGSFTHKVKTGHKHYASTITNMHTVISHIMTKKDHESGIIGPIGIITLMGKSLAISPHFFWFMMAIISLNIGLFNLLPLPFFDGGKALSITIEALTGQAISPTIVWYISMIFLMLFMLCVAKITIKDVKHLQNK